MSDAVRDHRAPALVRTRVRTGLSWILLVAAIGCGEDASSGSPGADAGEVQFDAGSGDGGSAVLDGHDGTGVDGGGEDGGDGGGMTSTATSCGSHVWNAAVPASGSAMMAYRSKVYLFGTDTTWTIVEHGSATIGAIPLPSGITGMDVAATEIAPSGRPFVTFWDQGQYWGAFFDGAGFVGVTALGQAAVAHADASERIYALTSTGLTEHAPGSAPVVRGAFPSTPIDWTVAADGTVYMLKGVSGQLRTIRLRRGALAWGDEVTIGTSWGNAGDFAAAPDGSLHIAFSPYGIYYRSRDGQTWATEPVISLHRKATFVDPVPTTYVHYVENVVGRVRVIGAQDYDHATIVQSQNYVEGASMPSYYVLRRCPPFDATYPAWPAERLAMTGGTYDFTPVAVDEHGMPAVLTPSGVRQDVVP